MENNEYDFVPLVERKDLKAHVIALLNQEWPRSEASRENSLSKSMNASPPMSFVLIEQRTGRVVGHVRLCPLVSDERGCWIESLIVSTDMRNRGLGRLIMHHVENAAKKHHFNKCYLSTEDKRAFYKKCGYECCEPILNAGSNTVLLKNWNLKKLFVESEEKKVQKDTSKTNGCIRSTLNLAVCSKMVPPAPPPPPSSPSLSSAHCSVSMTSLGDHAKRTQYMCKVLN